MATNHRHHPQRRDRAHLLDPACRQCAGADPRRRRAAGRRRPHRAAADAGRAQRRKARRRRQELRRGMDHRPRQGAGRSGLHGVLRRRRDQPAPGRAGKGDRRRQAHLFREAGGAVGRQGAGAAARDAGARAQARRGRGQARPARPAEARAARGVRFLRPRHRLPHRVRLVGVRRHRGAVPAAELELPQEGRRRADPRHVSALALRDREHARADAPRHHGDVDRDAGADRRARRALRRRRRGQRLDPDRAGERRDRHHPVVVGDAGAARRPADLPDRRHQRLGHRRPAPLLDHDQRADAAHRAFFHRHRSQRRLSRQLERGRRTAGRSRIPIASAGRISCAMS